jgi:hypothetical protein
LVRKCCHVGILKGDDLWTLVGRVERPNSWFLAIRLVEIDGLWTFGHSVKNAMLMTGNLNVLFHITAWIAVVSSWP